MRFVRRASLFALTTVLFILTLLSSQTAKTSASINSTINFQGKVVNSNGTNIADGTYNMEFKLYTGGDGVAGGGDETLQWTEDRLKSNAQGVVINNGIFQVNLGSVNPLPNIFNGDTIWLSMNVGDATSCSPFSTCSPDGEMSPFIRLTAAPYALNSDKLGGLQASNFVQLAQGMQTDSSTTNASIAINKTNASGTPNILQLQKSNSDVFVVDNSGAANFYTDTNYTYAGTENLAVTSDLAGSVDVVSVVTTPSSTSGTTRGMFVQQANSANTNGLDNGFAVDNADTDLAITNGLNFTNTGGGGYTNFINTGSGTFVVDGSGNLTAANITCSSASCISSSEITNGTITGDDFASSVAGDGLVLDTAATPDEIDVGAGNGITVNTNDVAVNQNFAFTWTADHTWNLNGTENLDVTSDLAGTVNMLGLDRKSVV